MCQGCFKDALREFPGCFNGVSCLKGVAKEFQGYFKRVSRKFQGSLTLFRGEGKTHAGHFFIKLLQ